MRREDEEGIGVAEVKRKSRRVRQKRDEEKRKERR